jgi:hypothetical protein
MKVAIEQVFDGSIQQVDITGSYDSTKINRGKHTGQYNLGSGEIDKFVGPAPLGVANFGESSLAMPSNIVSAVKINNDLYWIFGADIAAAAVTRRIQLWTYVPSTATYTFVGAILVNYPVLTNKTFRGLTAILTNYTTGSVTVNATTVTGSGTTWNTGISVGSRIGFGSTNPDAISTWYEVATISSDTQMTISSSAGTVASGSPYVIQDLMMVQAVTAATATNGGLFVTKGLRYEDFQASPKSIPSASVADKIKATYWLKDAATVTNDVIGGCAVGNFDSWSQQYVYCTEGSATSLQMYRYNLRAALTPLTAGQIALSGSDVVITGTQTVTGNISQNNNGRVATLNHGSGLGVPSLYCFTSTRILRIPTGSVTTGNTTFLADSMSEVPPGTTNTNISTGTFLSFDVAKTIDKLIILTAGANGTMYVSDYYTGGQQLDRRSTCLSSQIPSSLRDLDSPMFVHVPIGAAPFISVEDGWLFWMYGTATTTNTNALTAYPLAADFDTQADENNRIICPKINLGSNPSQFYRVLVNGMQNIGDFNMGLAPDMYKVQYRTSGIDDNSGAWTDVTQNGNLSGVLPASSIQFAFQFRTLGVIMLPARVLSLALIYETIDSLPTQYRWNFSDFNSATGSFAWIQNSLFGSLPTHSIEIYRADTNALVLTQSSTGSINGAFEFWNGSVWAGGLGTNTVGTRRRFVPSGSLPGSVDLYAKIIVL